MFPPGIGWVSHIGLATAHFTFSWSDFGEPLEYFAEALCFELYPLQEKETREHVAFRWQSSKRKMSSIAACQVPSKSTSSEAKEEKRETLQITISESKRTRYHGLVVVIVVVLVIVIVVMVVVVVV